MSSKNSIATILFSFGIMISIICFFIGLFAGTVSNKLLNDHFTILFALPWWVGGFICGMVFIGFSEIINLLQTIVNHTSRNEEPIEFEKINVDPQEKDTAIRPEEPFEGTFFNLDYFEDGIFKAEGLFEIKKDAVLFRDRENKLVIEIAVNAIVECYADDAFEHEKYVRIIYSLPNSRRHKKISVRSENSLGFDVHQVAKSIHANKNLLRAE